MGPGGGRFLLQAALRTARSAQARSGPRPLTCRSTAKPSTNRFSDDRPRGLSGFSCRLTGGSDLLVGSRAHLQRRNGLISLYTEQQSDYEVPSGVRGFASDLPEHQVLTMPSLSPTMTQGNLVEWKKKPGDEVAAGDVLCVIETDKATLDNESQEDGYLAKILLEGGAKDVPVGTPIAILAESADDVAKFADYTPEGAGGAQPAAEDKPAEEAPAPSPQESSPPSEPSSPPPPPAPSGPPPKNLGPSVKRLLGESGIDPRTLTGTGPHGIITKGDVLAAIEERGKQPKAAAPKAEPAAPKATTPSPSPPPPPPPAPKSSPPQPPPSGVQPPSEGEYEDLPNSQIRKVIAKRLLESKWGTPHYYISAEATIDATLAFRKVLKEKHGKSISVNDFVVKAVAVALREVPEANASFDPSTGEVKLNSSVDVSVAVATDRGLMTPIVKNADAKSLSAISAEVKSLAEKARTGKLKPEEFMGGTFSISNLGMFPVDRFNAIINPPQAGILAIGRGNKVAVWEDKPDGTGGPVTVTRMEVTLSADNRVMDGDVAGKFLEAVTANLTDPQRLIL